MIKALILVLLISLGLYFYFNEDEEKMAVKEIFPVNLSDKYNFQTKNINGKEISVSIAADDASFSGDVTKFSNRTTPITHEVKTIQIPEDYDVQDANSEAFLLMTNFKSTVADLIVGDKEGVVVVPNEIIKEISDEVKSMTIYEDYVIYKVQKGATIRGLYPLTDENEKKIFENWLRTKNSN